MNAQTKVALEDISEENAPAIYVAGGLSQFFDAVKAEVTTEVPDVSTRKGRERIASLAAKVSKSKTAVEKPGRDYLRKLKEMPKVVEAELREFVTAMDALRDETRQPLTEWQAAEDARIDSHQAVIDELNERGAEAGTYTADYVRGSIATVEAMIIDENLEEFEAEAHRAKEKALTALRAALAAREKQEAEQAELEELRRKQAEQEQKDREARIAQEAADQARRDAEAASQAERDAAANRERDLQLQAERAERERLEGEQRAAQAAQEAQARLEQAQRDADARAEQAAERERQRQAAEQQRIADEAAAREADVAHKKAVNNEALAAFIAGGMPEDCAKQAVTLIAKRLIPNISITY
ncbi:conserved protein of unknown function [Pseudomonas marincola]|uniref:Uncharacterized protein n=1 Tax=Pseudomonas marincola TaxID=437900 RepID=A0A653E8T0_9PSED|nr:hypothetical protein [Pseudomonas marincola]CAE6906083.1 conserved protein of unknown function [Pseudomonas marincola]